MEQAKRLSLAECRRILEEDGTKYSDEQILKIRDVLYDLGELDYLIFKEVIKANQKPYFDSDCNKAA